MAEQLGISYERVGPIIYDNLDIQKRSAECVLKRLNADQKLQSQLFQSSEQLLDFFSFGAIQNYFLSRLVTMDKTCLYHYDPETKQLSVEWQHSGSPSPKYSEYKNPV
jgi:hypothetical protein